MTREYAAALLVDFRLDSRGDLHSRTAAQKKATANKGKPKESASSLQQRREKDAEILRLKQKKKEEEKAATTSSGGDGAKK
ncbi:hypothetical protein BKA93DRAFT_824781 [Sparassis latifolia]